MTPLQEKVKARVLKVLGTLGWFDPVKLDKIPSDEVINEYGLDATVQEMVDDIVYGSWSNGTFNQL